jgi:hypothetical protein
LNFLGTTSEARSSRTADRSFKETQWVLNERLILFGKAPCSWLPGNSDRQRLRRPKNLPGPFTLKPRDLRMKRHINSLLQRKRADFDSAENERGKFQRPQTRSDAGHQVLVKDGYDWLKKIGTVSARVSRLQDSVYDFT